MSDLLDDLYQAVYDMDEDKAVELTEEALDEDMDPEVLLNEGLIPAMDEVGELYENGERYVPEMLLSAEAMKGSMKLLRPLLTESGVEPTGIVVLGTVEGDLHDIGMNLVGMMLEGGGFEVINLGPETPAEKFVEAVKEHNANLVGMSALLTTTMTHMPEVIEALEEEGVRDQVKVAIGGAPVSQDFADEIGADGYAADAASATDLFKKFVE